MAELTTSERLKSAQGRVKTLSSNRDQLIGDLRVEEQKLKQSYENLRELGIEEPETLTIKQLQALTEKLKSELAVKLEAIEGLLTKGEELMTTYRSLEESE